MRGRELPHVDELEAELLELAQRLVELGGCGDLAAQHGLGRPRRSVRRA